MPSYNNNIVYDVPSTHPDQSFHWKRLLDDDDILLLQEANDNHKKKIHNEKRRDQQQQHLQFIHTHKELMDAFQKDVITMKQSKNDKEDEDVHRSIPRNHHFTTNNNNNVDNDNYHNCYRILAEWSCIIGYCEALSTHKDPSRRYNIFPMPIQALKQRLVVEEYIPLLHNASTITTTTTTTRQGGGEFHSTTTLSAKNNDKLKKNNFTSSCEESSDSQHHRDMVQCVSNAIWKRAQNKKQSNSSMQDELHANSLYSCLRGDIDGKSLDCFGVALLTVLGMNLLGFTNSILTLSEDHAYESHPYVIHNNNNNNNTEQDCRDLPGQPNRKYATCEVAIPGNTLAVQAKRGQDISHTFAQFKYKDDNNNIVITPETSWLYMARNAVRCDTPFMVMAALVANLNCDIDKQKRVEVGSSSQQQPHIVSRVLYQMKRDMLWILHDDIVNTFPFALMELGECEEHLSSTRGMEWVDVSHILQTDEPTLVLRNEKLFLDAIQISRSVYGDAQVYPYLYCAHYHRDAGRDGEEYRLVESLRLYAEAARVACTYRYDSKDCLQLMKHFTTVAALIYKDILLNPQKKGEEKNTRRCWLSHENAVGAGTWLVGFFDSLVLWEENEQKMFVEVHNIQHKHFMGKLFQLLPTNIRTKAFDIVYSQGGKDDNCSGLAITDKHLLSFRNPKSQRLAKGSLLVTALLKEKISVRDMDLALPSNGVGRRSRLGKRKGSTQ